MDIAWIYLTILLYHQCGPDPISAFSTDLNGIRLEGNAGGQWVYGTMGRRGTRSLKGHLHGHHNKSDGADTKFNRHT